MALYIKYTHENAFRPCDDTIKLEKSINKWKWLIFKTAAKVRPRKHWNIKHNYLHGGNKNNTKKLKINKNISHENKTQKNTKLNTSKKTEKKNENSLSQFDDYVCSV